MAELNYGPDHCRSLYTAALAVRVLSREIQSTPRIGLPKVDAWAEPIIIIVAFLECFPVDKLFGNTGVASVVAKNEGGGKTLHCSGASSAVVFREAS